VLDGVALKPRHGLELEKARARHDDRVAVPGRTGAGDGGIGVLTGGIVHDGYHRLITAAGRDADAIASETENVVVGAVQGVDQSTVLSFGVTVLPRFLPEDGMIGIDGQDGGDDAPLRLLVDVSDDIAGRTFGDRLDRGCLGHRQVTSFSSQPNRQFTHLG
jgi:hypothetical protein